MINTTHKSRAIQKETKEQKDQRLHNERSRCEDHADKLAIRKEDEKKQTIYLTNMFAAFNVDYLKWKQHSSDQLMKIWENQEFRQVDFSDEGWEFLRKNFNFSLFSDAFGMTKIRFSPSIHAHKEEGFRIPGEFLKKIMDQSGMPRSTCASIYIAVLKLSKTQLLKRRHFYLPGLGRYAVHFRSARAERKGRNPKTGENLIIAAKPAHNHLHFSISKGLKEYIGKEVPVEFPKPKGHKKQEVKKRKRRKKVKSYFEEQRLPLAGKTLADV